MSDAVAILQLSDVHLGDNEPLNLKRKIDAAFEAVRPHVLESRLVVILSGDISFSASKTQYKTAEVMLEHIIASSARFLNRDVLILPCPGNHDVCNPQKVLGEYATQEDYSSEIEKNREFFRLAEKFGCKYVNGEYARVEMTDEGEVLPVSFTLVNSTPFSSRLYDKGAHIFPYAAFEASKKSHTSSINVLVMHHAPEWFDDASRLDIEERVYTWIDIAFYGHEHRGYSLEKRIKQGGNTLIIKGGTFEFDDEKECRFKVLKISKSKHRTFLAEEKTFCWDSSGRAFSLIDETEYRETLKCSTIEPGNEFINSLRSSEDVSLDYREGRFVFPLLREESFEYEDSNNADSLRFANAPDNLDAFFEEMIQAKYVEISGCSGSGKSTLLRALYFLSMEKGYSPLFLSKDNAHGSETFTLQEMKQKQYGYSPYALSAFSGLDSSRKIIFIDDFDSIKRKHRPALFIKEMHNEACCIVVTTRRGSFLSLEALDELKFTTPSDSRYFTIRSFVKEKRDCYIKQAFSDSENPHEDARRLIETVDRAVRDHFRSFELTPAFVRQYVDFYKSNSSALYSQEFIPFSSIVRSNTFNLIDRLLDTHGMPLTYNSCIFNIMQNIAYCMHVNRMEKVSAVEIEGIIVDYQNEVGIEFDSNKVKRLICRGDLMMPLGGGSFRFRSHNLFVYLVARKIDGMLDYVGKGINDDVVRLLDQIHIPVCEDIFIMLGQMRSSLEFYQELEHRAVSLLADVESFTFEQGKDLKVFSGLNGYRPKIADDNDARNATSIVSEMEEAKTSTFEGLDYQGYYEYGDPDLEDMAYRSFAALKYLSLLASCFVQNATTMKVEDKLRIREVLFDLPYKVLGNLLSRMDDKVENLIDELCDSQDGEGSFSEADARKFVAAFAVSLCIHVIDETIVHAAEKDLTAGLLLRNLPDNSECRIIGQLIQLHCGSEADFCACSCRCMEEAIKNGSWLESLTVFVISNLFLVEHQALPVSLKDRLVVGVFGKLEDSKSAKKRLLGQVKNGKS